MFKYTAFEKFINSNYNEAVEHRAIKQNAVQEYSFTGNGLVIARSIVSVTPFDLLPVSLEVEQVIHFLMERPVYFNILDFW